MEPRVLTITLFEDGRLMVSGPIGDKVLCYGMMELAKDQLRTFEPPKVVPVGPAAPE